MIDPVRLFTRPFCAPLFSTDILRAARAAPLVAVDGTRPPRVGCDFDCDFFPTHVRTRDRVERDREDISNLVSIVILTNVLEDEKRVVGTSNRIIEIRNISIERLLLFHANYLFYEFNSINSSLLSRVYFRFFFFFTRTRG